MATRRRALKRRRHYDGKSFWELLWGPAPWKGNALSVDELREKWESGGREAVMGSYFDTKPGVRPWAWWKWDFPDELQARG
jgi:hypothetical protein